MQKSCLLSVLLAGLDRFLYTNLNALEVLELVVEAHSAICWCQSIVHLRHQVVASVPMKSFQRLEIQWLLLAIPPDIVVLVIGVDHCDVFNFWIGRWQRQKWCVLHIQLFHSSEGNSATGVALTGRVQVDPKVIRLDQHVVHSQIVLLPLAFQFILIICV